MLKMADFLFPYGGILNLIVISMSDNKRLYFTSPTKLRACMTVIYWCVVLLWEFLLLVMESTVIIPLKFLNFFVLLFLFLQNYFAVVLWVISLEYKSF